MVVDGKAPITMALDLTDGSTLWMRDGPAGMGASGDGVVALKPLGGAFTGQGTPMVLDARSGRTRWTGRGPSRMREIGAGYVVFDTYGQNRPQRYEIVQLSSGDQITLTDAELSRIGQRSPTIVACDPPLLEWEAGSLLKSLPAGPLEEVSMPITGFSVLAGVDPYLWGTVDTVLPHLRGSVVALDRTGAQRTHAIPQGHVMLVDDQWLAVKRRGFSIPDDFGLELYAVSTP